MFKKMTYIAVLCTGVLLSSCTTTSPRANAVVVTDASQVVNCQHLGRLVTKSNIPLLHVGLESAKSIALDEAADSGATHLVWEKFVSGVQSEATASIYRC